MRARHTSREEAAGVAVLVLVSAWLVVAPWARGAEAAIDHAFFEKRIRPVLVDQCYACHSRGSEKLKAHLRLDTRAGMLAGGDSGPAIVPGDAAASRLVQAVSYANPDLQMPPRARLPEAVIADWTAWVAAGAPWPDSPGGPTNAVAGEFPLAARRATHWCWQPLRTSSPPEVRNTAWPRQPVDRFILRRLEQHGLTPAPTVDRRALIRRATFDLTGLPPTPVEVDAFLQDRAPGAWERVIDRLLASPRFGERWARHWLDLIRYAETLGHEFDYARHFAWRYRDYVIRAFNADLPYDQFVREQVAGDLLTPPRCDPGTGFNESALGTAWWWLGQQTHSPVDVRQHQADFIDNQIDVLTKTFLGLTVACARCHDHKFDAVSTRDFYALFGVAMSSRYTQRDLGPSQLPVASRARLQTARNRLRVALAATAQSRVAQARELLLATAAIRSASPRPTNLAAVASARGLDPARLGALIGWLDGLAASAPGHPLGRWATVSAMPTPDAVTLARTWREDQTRPSPAREPVRMIGDFACGVGDWMTEGDAFVAVDTRPGEFVPGSGGHPVAAVLTEPGLFSARWSRRAEGALRSPTFTITNRFLHVRAAGRATRVNVVIDNYTLIRDPIYGRLKVGLDADVPRWWTIDLEMWRGHRAYVEILDRSAPDPADDGHRDGFDRDGWVFVRQVLMSDDAAPPALTRVDEGNELLGTDPPTSLMELTDRYVVAVSRALELWGLNAELSPGQAALVATSSSWGCFDEATDGATMTEQQAAWSAWVAADETVPEPVFAPGMTDGDGVDQAVLIRGSPRTPGPVVPRRFLEALGGTDKAGFGAGSGRLELAAALTNPTNPLPARVMVNRLWLHLFGRGLVPTPDDFGVLGQPPSDPALLDWLAGYFANEAGWSCKRVIRLLMTSSAYQMSSRPVDASVEERDPDNRLLHRVPVRRLEGEVIRDEMLAVSGRLDLTLGGPSVPTHLTEFMDGRGRPAASGPLDGAGRRSIYLEVRNNFLAPMLRTFDTPVPFTTVGRRTESNVPAQSLILMNDPFVVEQARRWAERLLSTGPAASSELVRRAYRTAFAREPDVVERARAREFVTAQERIYREDQPEAEARRLAWSDFCHVLFNAKEFIYLD